jgi:N-methylhydantoinase B
MPMRGFAAAAGDVFRLVGAGGGGYGDALEREPERVLADVVAEKVSIDGAARDYGVVIGDDLGLDLGATQSLRAARRAGVVR